MESLNGDCVEKLLDILDVKSRMRFSLVCKSWRRLECECTSCPASLKLCSEDFGSTFIPWLSRDTSRVREVIILPGLWRVSLAEASWESMNKLLEDLSCRAPALRRLELSFPICTRVQERVINYIPFPFGNLLPCIALLSRLERLALRKWFYEGQEVPLIGHLSRLQNLEALELSCILFNRRANRFDVVRGAAQLLQQTISSLMRLTSLEMEKVDFIDYRCSGAVLPARNVGSLTNLRSLAFGSHRQIRTAGMELRVAFPTLSEVVNLTSLSLCCDASVGVPEGLLTSLRSLKEVAIDNSLGPQFPVLLSPSAVVTKLEITSTMNREGAQRLDSILPLVSLMHVKELVIHCKNKKSSSVEWPGDWGRLTALTKLAFHFQDIDNSNYILQEFFTAVRGLRDLEVTSKYNMFDNEGQEFILLLADRLAGLTRLQVNLVSVASVIFTIREVQPGILGGESSRPRDKVRDICQEVGQRVPGMSFAVEKVVYNRMCHDGEQLCVIATLNR